MKLLLITRFVVDPETRDRKAAFSIREAPFEEILQLVMNDYADAENADDRTVSDWIKSWLKDAPDYFDSEEWHPYDYHPRFTVVRVS